MAQARKNAMTNGVENIIGYTFVDVSILWEALQVPGANRYDIGGRNLDNGNKRLALLGDTILKTVLIDEWYRTMASRAQGNHIVSTVGNNAKLAEVARHNGLHGFINTHPGQFGAVATGTLADTVEAIIGAVWVDSSNLATVLPGFGIEADWESPWGLCIGDPLAPLAAWARFAWARFAWAVRTGEWMERRKVKWLLTYLARCQYLRNGDGLGWKCDGI
ncbi:MAG: hypothetical protein Q9217_002993 [Psora testacea]